MQGEHSEEALIRAAQQGDREAFASLYEANVERVYQYLARRMGQPADAEDVTAEVFIRAIKALPSFELKGVPFIAWLLRIAHNTAVNHMKSQSRRKELPLQEYNTAPVDDPADLALHRVESSEVSTAMKDLTDLQRQVLGFRFLDQLSIAETAGKMKRTEGAVKFLQHSALQAMRRILTREEAGNRDR